MPGVDPASLAIQGGQSLVQAGANIYSGKKQAQAAKQATAAQTAANKAQMAYAMQRDYDTARAAESAQRGNYEQWKAQQQTQNDLLQAREQRLGALGSLIGAPQRMGITTTIPSYVETPLPEAPSSGAMGNLRSYLG